MTRPRVSRQRIASAISGSGGIIRKMKTIRTGHHVLAAKVCAEAVRVIKAAHRSAVASNDAILSAHWMCKTGWQWVDIVAGEKAAAEARKLAEDLLLSREIRRLRKYTKKKKTGLFVEKTAFNR